MGWPVVGFTFKLRIHNIFVSITQYHVHYFGITIICIFTITSPCFYYKHPITFRWWFHIILGRRHKHVCLIQRSGKNWSLPAGLSLPWPQNPPTNSILISWILVGGQTAPGVFDLGYSPTCPTSSSAVSPAHQCAWPATLRLNIDMSLTVLRKQVQTSNTKSTDKCNPVRSIPQTHINTSNATQPPPPPSTNVL